MKHKHLIDLSEYNKAFIDDIINLAVKIYNNPSAYSSVCKGKILGTLFYEPSTRTQMSFQTAMLKLGGNIIGFDSPLNTSISKGENLVDTVKVVSTYADIIAMRHSQEGASLAGALYADCPVINAGDGTHLHPTQTLTDLVTLRCELSSIDNITVGLCGDLKNGRTVHSLVKALINYSNIKFVLISTIELSLPQYLKQYIIDNKCSYIENSSLEDAMADLDVLYMTRIQRERFTNMAQYEAQKDVYVLDTKKLFNAKKNLKILHPLPRIDEIAMEVDCDDRAKYFKQAEYGVYARMALIITLLSCSENKPLLKGVTSNSICKNPNCVTNFEKYLPKSYVSKGELICEYCDC